MHSRSNRFQTFRQDLRRSLTRLDRQAPREEWMQVRRFKFQARFGSNVFRRLEFPVPLFRSSLDRMAARLFLGRQDKTRRG
jgi:hypothetical protein